MTVLDSKILQEQESVLCVFMKLVATKTHSIPVHSNSDTLVLLLLNTQSPQAHSVFPSGVSNRHLVISTNNARSAFSFGEGKGIQAMYTIKMDFEMLYSGKSR